MKKSNIALSTAVVELRIILFDVVESFSSVLKALRTNNNGPLPDDLEAAEEILREARGYLTKPLEDYLGSEMLDLLSQAYTSVVSAYLHLLSVVSNTTKRLARACSVPETSDHNKLCAEVEKVVDQRDLLLTQLRQLNPEEAPLM